MGYLIRICCIVLTIFNNQWQALQHEHVTFGSGPAQSAQKGKRKEVGTVRKQKTESRSPVNSLRCILNVCNIVRPPSEFGIVPVSWFRLISMCVNLVKSPSDSGIVPVSWFLQRSKSVRCVICDIASGIVPANWLAPRLSHLKYVRVDSAVGISPPFFCRWRNRRGKVSEEKNKQFYFSRNRGRE